jgi:hypothetical protein
MGSTLPKRGVAYGVARQIGKAARPITIVNTVCLSSSSSETRKTDYSVIGLGSKPNWNQYGCEHPTNRGLHLISPSPHRKLLAGKATLRAFMGATVC